MKEDVFLRAFGKNIRKIREAKGISLREFEFRCDMTRQSLSKIELGKSNPTILTLKTIAEVLEVDLVDILKVK
jgi:transcriptional regulator with XRE-family HTH domain